MKAMIPFGTALMLFCSTPATPLATPAVAKPPLPHRHPPRQLTTDQALALYSPRAKRLVQSYLRLRLLERREADFDRIRAVIERRIGIDSLFGETSPQRSR